MPPTAPSDVLTPEAAKLAAGLETGRTSSTVKQEWGCGHSVWRVNGDTLYSACPLCHGEKIAR